MKKLRVIHSPKLLNAILFKNLKQLEKSSKKDKFIPYADLYEKLCRNFSIKKQELRQIIEVLSNNELVELSQIGIKLNYELEYGE